MQSLPIEVENKIWSYYYSDLYNDVLNELKVKISNFKLFNFDVNELLQKISSSSHYLSIEKSNLSFLNNQLIKMLNDRTYYLLFHNNNYFSYVHQIYYRWANSYSDIPESCKYLGVYINKKGNFNKKILGRFKVIASGEGLIMAKMRNLKDLINSGI
tara:strand:+ start:25218 stop:25688 length:471 start_codon:yes stop_codon:yes gene_type:complete